MIVPEGNGEYSKLDIQGKTVRAKQAKVHSAYFVQRDQHGIIVKDLYLTPSSILM